MRPSRMFRLHLPIFIYSKTTLLCKHLPIYYTFLILLETPRASSPSLSYTRVLFWNSHSQTGVSEWLFWNTHSRTGIPEQLFRKGNSRTQTHPHQKPTRTP
ncbi:hypothetical protein JHK82_016932 [Glycine max]|uniref:Uncharacterized protein n=1 Tax=Glycine max TaxID=3847 RepID=A0A0R0JNA4_SOYBN|nr:hypothetical protein JHK85_017351 [Glycine max]KAG5047573.1 hypothetical protein JHK86_016979 [Glycine max]KAG5150051.1 hypothetical protein JHK82_016932 [Glycine max]KAH1128291.1 hypothetical protein GYH30_016728 [Glycine max]